jgi:hypothetical protein
MARSCPGFRRCRRYFRPFFAYTLGKDKQRENVAAEPIRPSPKLAATVADSVQLGRMVLAQIQR